MESNAIQYNEGERCIPTEQGPNRANINPIRIIIIVIFKIIILIIMIHQRPLRFDGRIERAAINNARNFLP